MPMFVVERDLPGITPEQLKSAGLRAKSCCAEISEEGQPVRWIRSFFVPERSGTYCYFEARDRAVVEEANQRARIPFTRISEAIEMTPESM